MNISLGITFSAEAWDRAFEVLWVGLAASDA